MSIIERKENIDCALQLPVIEEIIQNLGPDEDDTGLYSSESLPQQTKVTGIKVPLVKLNDTTLLSSQIVRMNLSCDTVPRLHLVVGDPSGLTNIFEKPGVNNSRVQIQIIPPFDNIYKKINLTFYCTYVSYDDTTMTIDAIYNIPNLWNNSSKCWGLITTYDMFKEVAKFLKLGFYSNIDGTDDAKYMYCADRNITEVLDREVSQGGQQDCILGWWVDYWNNLNLVNVKERYESIDDGDDMLVWSYPNREIQDSIDSNPEPIQIEAAITNHPNMRQNQLYCDELIIDSNGGSGFSGTDENVTTYNMETLDIDSTTIMDGNHHNDLFIKNNYIGENFGETKYLVQRKCADMFHRIMRSNTMKVKLSLPAFSLMRGSKVNLYWYDPNSFANEVLNEEIGTNIPIDENIKVTDEGQDNAWVLDKHTTGQYYIMDSELDYNIDEGWTHTLTLCRPDVEQENYKDLFKEEEDTLPTIQSLNDGPVKIGGKEVTVDDVTAKMMENVEALMKKFGMKKEEAPQEKVIELSEEEAKKMEAEFMKNVQALSEKFGKK